MSERCEGAGEIGVATTQDSFGNWDVEWFPCPGCPDCRGTLIDELRAAAKMAGYSGSLWARAADEIERLSEASSTGAA